MQAKRPEMLVLRTKGSDLSLVAAPVPGLLGFFLFL